MDALNVCIVAPEFLPVWGGTGSYVVELVKFLPKEVNIHVVALKRSIPGMSENSLRNSSLDDVFKRDVNVHYISVAKETFFYNFGFQIECARKIPRLHKEYRFDILHTQFGHMSDIFLQLLKKVGIPNISTVHGTIAFIADRHIQASFRELELAEKQVRILYPLLRTLELLYAKRILRFIAVSEFAKERIIRDLRVESSKIDVVLNGVDIELFHPPSKAETENKYLKPTVVFMGRMIAKKGVHILIQAIPDILKKKPDTRFLFVGGGQASLYRKMIEAMGVPKENFSFTGHIDYFERPKILQQATIFVNPSFFELCSLSILEAMSCGASVVASDVGGNPELIKSGNDGLLVPASNSRRLSEAVVSLLENETLNRNIGDEARKTVESTFSSRKCAEGTFVVYKRVLSSL